MPLPVIIDLGDLESFQAQGAELATLALAYGIFLAIACISTYTLIRQGLRRNSSARRFLLATNILLIVSSTVIFATQAAGCFDALKLVKPVANDGRSISREIFSRINLVTGVFIIVWRAWALSDRRLFRVLLGICIGLDYSELPSGHIKYIGPDLVCIPAEFSLSLLFPDVAAVHLTLWFPTLFTNVVATSIVAYNVWFYRRYIKFYMEQRREKMERAEKVLVLLVESGLVHIAIMLVEILLLFNGASQVIDSTIVPFVEGIYPTGLILLVALTKEDESKLEADGPAQAQFAGAGSIIQSIVTWLPSSRQSAQADMPVLNIARMATVDSDTESIDSEIEKKWARGN